MMGLTQEAASGRRPAQETEKRSENVSQPEDMPAKETPAQQQAARPAERKRLPINRVGQRTNQVRILAGTMGLAYGSFMTIAAASNSSSSPQQLIALVFFIPLSVISGTVLGKGIKGKRMLERLDKYVHAMHGIPYISVAELSERTGIREKRVVKDLKQMIESGVFPQGHLNEKEDYFMLDDASYEQYREAYARYLEAERQRDIEDQISEEEKQVRAMVATGENYISQIRAVNDVIPGREVSEKLDRLEFVTGRIFEAVQKYPEKRGDLERFMEYYMPTTLKLVNTYKLLDEQPVQGENILSAKAEIERSLDSINTAYEKLYDDMFKDVAWDISTDISVMENMFAREGLKEKDFKTTTTGS